MVQREQVRTTGGNVRHRLMFPAWRDHMAISAGRARALRHYRRGRRRSTKSPPGRRSGGSDGGAPRKPRHRPVAAPVDGAAPRRRGRRSVLILDTGAEETVLTAAAAARLGLRPHYEYPRHLHSVSGAVVTGEARLKSLAVGNAAAADFIVLVGALALPHVAGVQPAGLLGGDFLSRFDVALDLANGRLALYRPGCALLRPPWRGAYTSLPAKRSIDNRLFFPGDLDGRKLFALIDTGAQISACDRAAVRDLGISRTAIARDPG